jgi:hypothetical protein
MKNMFGIDAYRAPLGRRKLFVNRYPARWAGLRDDGPLGLNLSANGAQFLSPGQRPGFASPTNIMRPERPRHAEVNSVVAGYRTPSRRINVPVACYRGICTGLRDDARLALASLGKLEAEIQQGMKELEGMLR